MKKILLLSVLILLITGLTWWAYPIMKSRYFSAEKTPPLQIFPEEQKPEQDATKENQQIPPNTEGAPESIESKTPADSFINIATADCDNECANFENDEKNLKYCQEICGLTLPMAADNCENLKNLEKDYCLKDLAVSKKDYKVCDQIQDSGIKETCRNRITEEILGN